MKLVLNKVTYHNCPVRLREKISLGRENRLRLLKLMRNNPDISEAAIIETCNRIEFYIYAEDDFDVKNFLRTVMKQLRPEAAKTWESYSSQSTGLNAAGHLFEVSGGLDSQMPGENQVLSQVKAAYSESLDCGMSRLMFHRLFHNAFRVGKVIRTETDINCGAVSVGLAAVELAKKRLNLSTSAAMLIGAGENTELIAGYLLKAGLAGLIIANRTPEKAKALSLRLGRGEVIGLDEISRKINEVDVVISSTAAEKPVIKSDMLGRFLADRQKPLLVIDLAVPRDVDVQLSRFGCVSLYNIDDLNEQINRNRKQRCRQLVPAKRIIAEFTGKFARWCDCLDLVPLISKLTEKGTELANTEAKRYAKDFGDSDKLELFAQSLVKKVMHGPITFLKATSDSEPAAEQLHAANLINKMFLSRSDNSRQ